MSPNTNEVESTTVDGETVVREDVEKPPMDGPRPSGLVQAIAIIGGILGFLCFAALPLLPVNQTQTSLSWPQNDSVTPVTAPLMAQAPIDIDVEVPINLAEELPGTTTVVVGTLPPTASSALNEGLQVRKTDDSFDVVLRDRVVLSLDEQEYQANQNRSVVVHSDADRTIAEVPGAVDEDGEPLRGVLVGDTRPQLTGVYTDLPDDVSAQAIAEGLSVTSTIDSRFTSTPSLIKVSVMIIGMVLMVSSLVALARIDRIDGTRPARWLRRDAKKFTLIDAIVVGTLLVWHVIGANTSDDGYIFTMGRASEGSGYMANYYRWFGVPESPFGWPYYDLLAEMAKISTASMWMRLPALIAGLLVWFTLSRLIIPRLGSGIASRRVAYWSAGGVLLSFWLPYNNGLRPEPVIACGALLTWVFIERAVYTRRLLPAAIAVIIATLSLGSGPTGLMAVAALLGGLPALIRIVVERHRPLGGGVRAALMQLAPFLAAGTAILVGVFGDQTLASVLEAVRVRGAVGPSMAWYEEPIRWYWLLLPSADGSMERRFAVILVLVCLMITIAAMLRHRTVPGAVSAPASRLVFMYLGTVFFMTFTPTKWTHHFGVYAGIGAALAALAAMAISHWAVRSRRNQVLFVGAMVFLLAYALTGTNGWWYVSSYGVPWFDKTVQLRGVEANTIVLAIALVIIGIGAALSFYEEYAGGRSVGTTSRRVRLGTIAASPIVVSTFLIVGFSVASLGKGMVSQYPAYSVGLGNLRSLTGNHCALADDILMETNTNEDFLRPIGVDLKDSLAPGDTGRGFTPNGLPRDMTADAVWVHSGITNVDPDELEEDNLAVGQNAGTNGGFLGNEGVNGSRARLPYGLNRQKIPVLGSYSSDIQVPAALTSAWFALPKPTEDTPLLVVTAAGRIAHNDFNGVRQPGQRLVFEFGRDTGDGFEVLGDVEPLDIGPEPSWRNLRTPMDQVPEGATAVRLVAEDFNLDDEEWLAVTPPRVPRLAPLTDVIGDDPTLPDWVVALQFPCQRAFDHFGGVAENPKFRIMPDREMKVSSTDTWQGSSAGGVLGIADTVNDAVAVPTYEKDDWGRDWGSVERLTPRRTNGVAPVPAEIDSEVITRSGLWSPGKMIPDDDGNTANQATWE
ncbi:arabinosyltransferase domain-containing protein [Corynebacterium sp. TAE3-ERU12]|uniref:arabinosyltransferase domain-containing protein n=1 Tax=Corynebacterium sp. TAE3-ERU12 TaxID=2849491 RepID=UPI001C45D686|nr:arabinosyltransferase domain-containing protein [Corynebacterium sp. TAE3-ERU12]MBV7294409.1 arabinosyltransferase domain-containing protein [Corynebacterium sp. TAE3-ERU12]